MGNNAVNVGYEGEERMREQKMGMGWIGSGEGEEELSWMRRGAENERVKMYRIRVRWKQGEREDDRGKMGKNEDCEVGGCDTAVTFFIRAN